MGRINWGRVLLGGLVAGLVINLGEFVLNGILLRDDFATVMQDLGLDPEGASIAVWVFYAFLFGITAVWMYAAIRPRFGAGPKTAVLAGLTVWFIQTFFSTVAMLNMGLFPRSMLLLGLIWGLVEIVLATLLGASLYKESEA
ncbi:MAG: hypothetical protein ABR576_12960 [Thermoanaerobaculia bacterium]